MPRLLKNIMNTNNFHNTSMLLSDKALIVLFYFVKTSLTAVMAKCCLMNILL